MIRCKLEYLIKGIDIVPRKRLIFLIDKDNTYDFHRVNTKAIEDFKNAQYDLNDEVKQILYEVEKENDRCLREKYKKIFTEINQICIEDNLHPIFKDPSDIEECLKLREDLLKVYNEEDIKSFFNGKSLREYEPPLLRDVYLYPAILKKEDDGYSVTVPDIFGVATFGDNYEDAISIAQDMVKMMLEEAPSQCFKPKSLEETQKKYPNNIVVMIKVELERKKINEFIYRMFRSLKKTW